MKVIIVKILLSTSILAAQNNVSNAELSKKLDLILQTVQDLDERVTKLESANVEVRKEVDQVAKSAEEAKKTSNSIPEVPEEKKSFLQKLGNQLKTQQTLDRGPWTKRESWREIRKNISAFQVRKILGNPTKIKKSINPRIDQTFQYIGDLNADGVMDKGTVSFHRDRVIDFESPFD